MSQPLRIALFDQDEAWATNVAASLLACGLSATVCHSTNELRASPTRAEVDAIVVSWPRVDDELALLVEVLSRDYTVVALVTDCDVRAAHLLFVSGATEVCHPLLPAQRLAGIIEKSVVSSRKRRLRTLVWHPTA